MSAKRRQPGLVRRFLGSLGPGVITGAADDDPSGIATYSIAGAQHGLALLWTALITWPLMAPSVTANVLLAVVGAMTVFQTIYVLTDGQNGTMTLGMLSFNTAFGTGSNLAFGAAVSTSLFLVTLVVAVPLMWALRWRERRLLG